MGIDTAIDKERFVLLKVKLFIPSVKLYSILMYNLKRDIIKHYYSLNNSNISKRLYNHVTYSVSKYCLVNATKFLMNKECDKVRQLVLLSASYDCNITKSALFSYVLNNTEYDSDKSRKLLKSDYFKELELKGENSPVASPPYDLPKGGLSLDLN